MKTKEISLKRYKKYRKLKKLCEEWTRLEVMSRLGLIEFPLFVECATKKIDKEDEIRELLFGTSQLYELGKLFKLPVDRDDKKDNRRKRVKKSNNKKLQKTRKARNTLL